jgi:hypothetical protein
MVKVECVAYKVVEEEERVEENQAEKKNERVVEENLTSNQKEKEDSLATIILYNINI